MPIGINKHRLWNNYTKIPIGIILVVIWLIGLYCLAFSIFTWWSIILMVLALMISTIGWWYILTGR